MKTAVKTVNAPQAIGPYSQAVIANGLVFCSGQIALDPASGIVVDGGIREQAERVMLNLQALLAEAGTDFSRVVRATVYLKTMSDFAAVNEIYGRYVTADAAIPPSRSTVAVAGLPRDVLVEIDLIALAG